MFLVDKTYLIRKCATWKVFFMYWSLISAEHEPHVIMSLRFPSDFKFLWGGHFSRFFGEDLEFQKKSILFSKISKFWNFWKFNYPQSIDFLSITFYFLNGIDSFFRKMFFWLYIITFSSFSYFRNIYFSGMFFCVIEFIQKAIYSNV